MAETDAGVVTQTRPRSDEHAQDHYTGVVIIHGLGDIKRSDTLTEATNALAYWYNHHADLDLRREGAGRIWVDTSLNDDPSPNGRTARATIELAPPERRGSAKDSQPLRLKFREVWWAGASGLPPVQAAIQWTQVQFSEQSANLRSLFDGSSDRRGKYAPPGSQGEVAHSKASDEMISTERGTLKAALAVYDVIQYAWTAAQWTVLSPLIFLLLILLGPLKLLRFIPGIGPSIVNGLTRLLDYIMLRWIAEAQVYALDYSRSAGIRSRFEKEFKAFQDDRLCDRIVVIAHSMGTVIAYEGLTDLLPKPGAGPLPKPVTFICLAQALRRIWLMTPDDPHRLRDILHDDVRWLHFWARYDPVTAGPLTRDSLPQVTTWPDATHKQLADRIARCQNVAVVNTDSTITDHTTYWMNLEQVVGPIARELVEGHSALANLVESKLATPDDHLRRRWSIGWRFLLALVVGVGVAASILTLGALDPTFGAGLTNLFASINWHDIVNTVCPVCTTISFPKIHIPSLPPNPSIQEVLQYATNDPGTAMLYLFNYYLTPDLFVLVAVALILMALGMEVVTVVTAKPSPFLFPRESVVEPPRVSTLFALAAIGVALLFLASIVISSGVRQGLLITGVAYNGIALTDIWSLGIAEIAFWISGIASVLTITSRRQIGWLVCLILGLLVAGANDPMYNSALLVLAVVGCGLRAYAAFKTRSGWSLGVSLALVGLIATYAGISTKLHQAHVLSGPILDAVGVEFLAPMLFYAIWLDLSYPVVNKTHLSAQRKATLALAPIYVALLAALSLPVIFYRSSRTPFQGPISLSNLFQSTPGLTLTGVTVAAALVISVVMLVFAFADAAVTNRRRWVIGILVSLVGLTLGLFTLIQLGATPAFAEWGVGLSCAIATPALIYAIWARTPDSTTIGRS
jgi:hypothetical protein